MVSSERRAAGGSCVCVCVCERERERERGVCAACSIISVLTQWGATLEK